MRRATTVKAAGQWDLSRQVDQVVLDAADRYRRRMVLTGEAGEQFLLDLPAATMLGDGDGLVLEDGSIIRVAGLIEQLVELSAPTPRELIRLAWHLGNRHTDVEIVDGKLRFRRDHVLEDMVTRLGAVLTVIEAPFAPAPSAPHSADHADGDHGGEPKDRQGP
jgi:urease accessory protein